MGDYNDPRLGTEMKAPEIRGGRAVMKPAGRFDYSCLRQFRGHCTTCVEDPQVRSIEIDFGSVTYMDSSILGMLLMLLERADAAKKTVLLSHCHGTPREILAIAGFEQLFEIT